MKILFTAEHDETMIDRIRALGEVRMAGVALGGGKLSDEEMIELATGVDIIIVSYDDVTAEVMDAAPNLKLVACTRATPVNVDVSHAKTRGIPVIYTPGRNSDSAAEMTICLMLCCARNVHAAYRAMHNGEFLGPAGGNALKVKEGLRADVVWGMGPDSPYAVFKGCDLKNKTLGIIGYGSIGKRVGDIAEAFGMHVLLYDPYVNEVDVNRPGRQKVDLDTLLKESDFVSCHLKVTPATTGLMNAERFAMMKPTAYFINTSRAAVVDEAALIAALREGRIAGAGLDVFEKEPLPKDHPFVNDLADRVAITPHIGGATKDAITNHTIMLLSDIERYFKGEPMLYTYRY
ncbi:MAG: 2-hydroxyacid dehydrogenase [Christensenellales bacterium]|jgi:D-3-phosphoglycerate dehydrogenase